VRVAQFGAPSEEERRHHFLWRFAAVLPGRGEMSVLDRTWYGRVLVERVEELVAEERWRAAYEEIVDFERALVRDGTTIVKLWLHISPEEQLRRFEARRADPLRRWKLTDEDWRNRGRWDDYLAALADVLAQTDHEDAPWDLVPAESKHFARLQVLETVVARLEAGMRRVGVEPPPSTGQDYDEQG
jgi:polyphosphate kinase 2 (PPK2 family)